MRNEKIVPYDVFTHVDRFHDGRVFAVYDPEWQLAGHESHRNSLLEVERRVVARQINDAFLFWEGIGDVELDADALSKCGNPKKSTALSLT